MEGNTLASQWGRDSGFQSGGKRGGGAATISALILALALGVAGGYGAFRFTQPDPGAALDDVRTEATRLNEALATARQELEAARAARESDTAQIDELNATIARQAGELDAMTEKLAASTAEAPAPQDGTAAIETATRERDALAAENLDLQQKVTALEAERDALNKDAGADRERLEAEIARLQNDVVPQLTAERDALNKAAGADRDRLEAEIARLRDDVVPQLTAERDQLQRKVSLMLTDQATLKARIKATSDANASDAQMIADLQARLAEAQRKLTASEAELATIKVRNTEAAANEAAATAADKEPAEPATGSGAQDSATQTPRDPAAVAAALRAAPGLETLSDDARRKLTERLVAGDCVTTALESVFDRVPVLALRNLIRDLNSGC